MGDHDVTHVTEAEARWRSFQEHGYRRVSGDPPPPVDQVSAMWGRAMCAYDAAAAQFRRALGLNTHERLALSHLWQWGAQPMGALGERLALSRAAMTALVDRLEQAGFVERETDPGDRRRTILRATGEAFRQGGPSVQPFHERLLRHAEQVTHEEWAAIVRFLDVVHDAACERAAALGGVDDVTLREAALDAQPADHPG